MHGAACPPPTPMTERRGSRRPRWIALTTLAATALALASWLYSAPSEADDITVHAERRDRLFVVDVEASVPAPADIVWDVLTDYDHMSAFMSAMKSSAVTRRDGARLEVAQTMESRVGPFKFVNRTVRAVQLTPMREIRSTLVGGDLETLDGTTRVVERGAVTVIVNHSEYTPKAWLPPVVGASAVESETRRQYTQMLAEMVRRAAQRATAAPR
jgi:uncharacterized membrane protein